MDAEYLKETVGETLASGLAAMVMNDPADPVDYLAKWLLNYVDNVKREQLERQKAAEQKAKDEREQALRDKREQKKILMLQAKQSEIEQKHDNLRKSLEAEMDFKNIWQNFITKMKESVGCSSVYAAKLEESREMLTFFASTEGQEFMVNKTLSTPNPDDDSGEPTGVLFTLFKEEEDDGDAASGDDDDARETKSAAAQKVVQSIMVPDVLMGPYSNQIKFFGMPQCGAFYACRVKYGGTLNTTTLDQAVKRLEEIQRAGDDSEDELTRDDDADPSVGDTSELDTDHKGDADTDSKAAEADVARAMKAQADEEALLASIKLQPMEYVVCFDTLGQNRRFSVSEVSFINKYTLQLSETLERIDRTFFKAERRNQAELALFNTSHEMKLGDLDDEDLADARQKLDDLGLPNTPLDVKVNRGRSQLLACRKMMLAFNRFHVFRGDLAIVQAFLYMLKYPQSAVCHPNTNTPHWELVRQCFDEQLITAIKEFDPRDFGESKKDAPYNTDTAITTLIESVNESVEDLKDINVVLAEMVLFIQDAQALKRQAKEEHEQAEQEKRDQEAAELLEQQEEEERQRLAAQDEGSGDDDDDN